MPHQTIVAAILDELGGNDDLVAAVWECCKDLHLAEQEDNRMQISQNFDASHANGDTDVDPLGTGFIFDFEDIACEHFPDWPIRYEAGSVSVVIVSNGYGFLLDDFNYCQRCYRRHRDDFITELILDETRYAIERTRHKLRDGTGLPDWWTNFDL